jgi:hypothetical protein
MIRMKEIRFADSVKSTVMYYVLQYNGQHYTPTPSRTRATMFVRRTVKLYFMVLSVLLLIRSGKVKGMYCTDVVRCGK